MPLGLTRRSGEEICIGDDVIVKIISIQGDKVRLGIEAPADVSVDRAEIRQAKKQGTNPKQDRVVRTTTSH